MPDKDPRTPPRDHETHNRSTPPRGQGSNRTIAYVIGGIAIALIILFLLFGWFGDGTGTTGITPGDDATTTEPAPATDTAPPADGTPGTAPADGTQQDPAPGTEPAPAPAD